MPEIPCLKCAEIMLKDAIQFFTRDFDSQKKIHLGEILFLRSQVDQLSGKESVCQDCTRPLNGCNIHKENIYTAPNSMPEEECPTCATNKRLILITNLHARLNNEEFLMLEEIIHLTTVVKRLM
ncbi:hypothetical protein C0584_04555 [Candidatus Parcubacteria bacterium]|nr:MAG: hypothetical protein C0584_04555 [Candidatus Parcubacteria bacterium]